MEAFQRTQILRFVLAGENYAFDVLKTREVLTYVNVTPLPGAQEFLAGVINLRGSVIPVVDLRRRFGLPTVDVSVDTSILIVEIAVGSSQVVLGAIVDAVKGVAICEAAELERPPQFGLNLRSGLIHAIARQGGEFVVILATDRVFSEAELGELRHLSA